VVRRRGRYGKNHVGKPARLLDRTYRIQRRLDVVVACEHGAAVHGYALAPEGDPNLFTDARVADHVEHELGDIRNLAELECSMAEFKPEVVFHMAAQPLVRRSYRESH